MRKIVLEEQDIKEFEQMINSFPCFAKNVGEVNIVAHSVGELMKFMGGKIQTVEETDPKPIGGGGGGSPKPKPIG